MSTKKIISKNSQVQVNLCQKLLFLHQLTHNMMTDCSLFMKIVSSEYLRNMLCTQIVVFALFWHSEQLWYTTCSPDVVSFWKRFTCTMNFFTVQNSAIEKVSFVLVRWKHFKPHFVFILVHSTKDLSWRALQSSIDELSYCINRFLVQIWPLDFDDTSSAFLYIEKKWSNQYAVLKVT
jgi:hypothetical protein